MNILFILALVVGWVVIPKDASAYIDPGTGSFIFQMLVASILGVVLTIKLWYGAVKAFFRHRLCSGKQPTDVNPCPSEASEDASDSNFPSNQE